MSSAPHRQDLTRERRLAVTQSTGTICCACYRQPSLCKPTGRPRLCFEMEDLLELSQALVSSSTHPNVTFTMEIAKQRMDTVSDPWSEGQCVEAQCWDDDGDSAVAPALSLAAQC